MSLATRGMGSPNLIPTSGLGNYGSVFVPPEEPSGGSGGRLRSFLPKITRVIHKDIKEKDYRLKQKEVTPKQAIELLPKEAVKEAIKAIKHELGVLAPEARQLLIERAKKQIEAMRLIRISELNQESIALILIAIGLDE